MHLFRASPHIYVHPSLTSSLPPELWELVCSFLPKKEVCRLRSLNSVFFTAALAIHYDTLTIETDDQRESSLTALKFKFDVMTGRVHRRQYGLDKVHTLRLRNNVPIAAFYSYQTGGPRVPGREILFNTRFSERLVAQQLRCLHNVQNLHLTGRPFGSKTFGRILFHSLSRTLVHLDLAHSACIDLYGLGDTVLCPNVRSLVLSVDEPNTITVPLPTFIEQGMLGIRSLVPSDIESLKLQGQLTSYSISLSFFNKLKKLTCRNKLDAQTRLPFAIPELINANAETLVDIEVDLTALPISHYEELNWSEQVHTLSLSGLAFYQKRHIYLPRLERCKQIRKFTLEGNLWSIKTLDLETFHHSLLLALSQSATQLDHLEIPFRTLSPRRVWDIACNFPNLDTVVFHGISDRQELETFRFVIRIRSFLTPCGYSPKVIFHSLREIRKGVGECSSSDFWHEHSTTIEKTLTRNSTAIHNPSLR